MYEDSLTRPLFTKRAFGESINTNLPYEEKAEWFSRREAGFVFAVG
jgi:hypothetical protein